MDLKGIVSNKKFTGALLAFICAFFLLPPLFTLPLFPLAKDVPAWFSLDSSWRMTVNLVNQQHLTWGEEFVFTYGPLAFLSTRFGWGVGATAFVLFDIFLFANFFYIFFRIYTRSERKLIAALLILSSTWLLPFLFGARTSLILMAMLLFWIGQSFQRAGFFIYTVQLILVILVFFIKFNAGLISLAFYLTGLGINFVQRKPGRWQVIIWLAISTAAFLLVAKSLDVSLPSYVVGGLEMIKGYNGIMYLTQSFESEYIFSILLLVLSVVHLVLRMRVEGKLGLTTIAFYLLFCVSAFVLYKQSFIRNDWQHVSEFYTCFLFLLLCISDVPEAFSSRLQSMLLLAMIVITLFFGKRREDYLVNTGRRLIKTDYFNRLTNYTDTSGMYFLARTNNPLPEHILRRLSEKTVDVYPWNAQLLIENKLDFRPRPAFQSCTAYTPWLEKRNIGHYNSSEGPDAVVYELATIDERYALFDEPQLNLLLMRNYLCTDTFRSDGRFTLLLEKKVNARPIAFQNVTEYEIKIGKPFVPRDSCFYELDLNYSIAGKVISALRYDPAIQLEVRTADGNSHWYRTSAELLRSGIFSTQHFGSTLDFYRHLGGQTDSANLVTAYRLVPSSSSCFDEKIKIKEHRIR